MRGFFMSGGSDIIRRSDILVRHGVLWPFIFINGKGVVVRAVHVRQNKRLLVFGFGVEGGNVVSVGVVHNLRGRTERGGRKACSTFINNMD